MTDPTPEHQQLQTEQLRHQVAAAKNKASLLGVAGAGLALLTLAGLGFGVPALYAFVAWAVR